MHYIFVESTRKAEKSSQIITLRICSEVIKGGRMSGARKHPRTTSETGQLIF